MEQVCPLCNGLFHALEYCKKCGTVMEDTGKVSDYYGPYSPYEEVGAFNAMLGEDPRSCIHLFYCATCGEDRRIEVKRLEI